MKTEQGNYEQGNFISNAWYIGGPVIFLAIFFLVPLIMAAVLSGFEDTIGSKSAESWGWLGMLLLGLGTSILYLAFIFGPFALAGYALVRLFRWLAH